MTTTAHAIRAKGIDAIHVLVQDFNRALAFYRDALGLRVATQNATSAEFELADGSAFGIAYMPDFFIPGGGMMFAVDDARAATEAIKALGLRVFEEPFESQGCITTWCADTEGNYFALHQRKAHA